MGVKAAGALIAICTAVTLDDCTGCRQPPGEFLEQLETLKSCARAKNIAATNAPDPPHHHEAQFAPLRDQPITTLGACPRNPQD